MAVAITCPNAAATSQINYLPPNMQITLIGAKTPLAGGRASHRAGERLGRCRAGLTWSGAAGWAGRCTGRGRRCCSASGSEGTSGRTCETWQGRVTSAGTAFPESPPWGCSALPLVLRPGYRTLGTAPWVPCPGYRILGTTFRVPHPRYHIPQGSDDPSIMEGLHDLLPGRVTTARTCLPSPMVCSL